MSSFDFLTQLPDAVVTQPFEKHPGIFIRAALVEGEGHNVFLEAIDGMAEPVFTLNIGGRGALVFGETEFRDILSAGLAMFEVRQPDFVAPTDA